MVTQQQLQQKIQSLTPANKQRFMTEQKAFFDATKYEGELSEQLPRYRQFAMMHESEASLGISFDYWEHMGFGVKNDNYFIQDVLTFLRASEKRTFKEWITTFPAPDADKNKYIAEWREYRQFVDASNAAINPIVEQFILGLLDKLLRIQHLDLSGQSKSIPTFHNR